jgi:ABC-2 type transport system ATP-binding protein
VAVSVEDVSLVYGPHSGVFNISLEIDSGICILAGNNGAGKTTLLEMLQGLRTPDSGHIQILGRNPISDRSEVVKHVGSALQGVTPYPTARPRALLKYLAGLYPSARVPDELMDEFSIPDARSIKNMSGGEVQRLKCAMALIGKPQVVFLDEPTAGLDPGGRQDLYRVLRQQESEGIVMLVSTHLTEDIDSLCSRALVLRSGQLIADLRAQDLGSSESMTFRARPHLPIEQLRQALPQEIRVDAKLPDRYQVTAVQSMSAAIISSVAAWCAQHGTAPEEISISRSTLSNKVLEMLIKDPSDLGEMQ